MKILTQLPLKESLLNSLRITQGQTVSVGTRKYKVGSLKVFALHGCTCVRCGREGKNVTVWEDNGGGTHVDLFTENMILMNRDHIIPKSKKGANSEWNYQTMCIRCNCKKGNNETPADLKLATFRRHWRDIHVVFHDRFWKVLPKSFRKGKISVLMAKWRERHAYKATYIFARATHVFA